MSTTTALVLLAAATGLLFVNGEIYLGNGEARYNLPDWPTSVAVLAAAAAVVIAIASSSARLPVAWTILAVSAVLVVLGPTPLISFYSADGFFFAIGLCSLAALWLVGAGRRPRRRWSNDLLRRSVLYLTVILVLLPTGFLTFVAWGCSEDQRDECGFAGVIGIPVAVVAWLVVIVGGELLARSRRRLWLLQERK